MNGTAENLASITPDVIWIPYSMFIVLTIAVLALSFVRYHRRKIAKRKYAKEYADENLQLKRARISGITCNSNDMRLKDLGSSMMHPDAFRLYSDLSIQALPNFARHNLDLRSSKSAEDGSIDVNKIVIEDWMEQTELKVLRNQTISAGFHNPVLKSIKSAEDGAEDGSIDVNKIVIEDWIEQAEFQAQTIPSISAGFNKDSLGCFHRLSTAGLYEESSEGFRKDISESCDLVEIGIDDVCESCKTTVLQYHEHTRPRRLKTLSKSQDMIQPYDLENASHQLAYKNDVKSIGNTDVPQTTVYAVASTIETIPFTTSDIYAKPNKKFWSHKGDMQRNKLNEHKGVSENTADTVASTVDIDKVLSERKRYENSNGVALAHQRKTLPKRKQSYHRQPLSKNRRVTSPSMSHTKRTYSHTYHKRPGSQMEVATDYSSTTSSERESDDEYRPYEEIWTGDSEYRQAFNQNRKGSQNIHYDPSEDASTSDKRNRNRTKRLQKSCLLGIPFHISEIVTDKLKTILKMNSISDVDTTVKSNSSSENSVIIEKQFSAETPQINANTIEKVKSSGKLNMESNSEPGIPKKMRVGLHAKSEDNIRSIGCHHQLMKSTTLQNPCDQYFNYTDAEKMKRVAPKNIDNRSGNIYWLDIHNEDTMV